MSPTAVQHTPLTLGALREIARQEGPCVTLLIPDHQPWAKEPSRATLVRSMARLAADLARTNKLDGASWLQPIEEYASAFEGDAGGEGVALFCSPNFVTALSVCGIRESKVTLGPYFNLAPLITPAFVSQTFYVLALNRKNLHLYHYQQGSCNRVGLPAGVPASMEVALDLDQPDHTRRNRSAAGTSTGSMHAVGFGTSSDREEAHQRLHHFFQLVDQGLSAFLRGTPLLLAGVHEEVAAYRAAAKNTNLLETEIQGNVDFLTPAEIAQRASVAAMAQYRQTGEAVVAKYKDMPDRKRACGTAGAILSAAIEGQVHKVCISGTAPQDLVNPVVVETLRHGGEVFMLRPENMPGEDPMAAILRF